MCENLKKNANFSENHVLNDLKIFSNYSKTLNYVLTKSLLNWVM